MRIARLLLGGTPTPALIDPERRIAWPATALLDGFTGGTIDLLDAATFDSALRAAQTSAAGSALQLDGLRFGAPYDNPPKIWGIGLNYSAHARDLSESVPTEPASFIKGNHTIIGPGDTIRIPAQSERTTSEGEVGLVIGRLCQNVNVAEAMSYVFGLVPILDQTAEDILQRNPRFLTRSKNFPTFFSFGPEIVPLSELEKNGLDWNQLRVDTIRNDLVVATNITANMTFPLAELISFHSRMMPLFPGDIISTGTPGAAPIHDGDVMSARVEGVGEISNPVAQEGSVV